MTTDERIAAFLAERAKLEDPSLIHDVRMEASEGRVWSEITVETFGCFVKFRYGDEEKTDYWGEEDAVRFLNVVWDAQITGEKP